MNVRPCLLLNHSASCRKGNLSLDIRQSHRNCDSEGWKKEADRSLWRGPACFLSGLSQASVGACGVRALFSPRYQNQKRMKITITVATKTLARLRKQRSQSGRRPCLDEKKLVTWALYVAAGVGS